MNHAGNEGMHHQTMLSEMLNTTTMQSTLLILLVAALLLLILILTLQLRATKNARQEAIRTKLIEMAEQQRITEQILGTELARNREELRLSLKESRQEQSSGLQNFEGQLSKLQGQQMELMRQDFDQLLQRQRELRQETEQKLESIRHTLEQKIIQLQEDNSKKLEQMRQTVDEKLHESLERRFTESFKLIGQRLEEVQKGLGEMQNLATGVGDLKKVLSNVKSRGTLGEIQLGAILDQILSPEQYEKNAAIKPQSQERVEYAIKLPGQRADHQPLLLPIDSKFPIEDFLRLSDAYENAELFGSKELEQLGRQFETAVKKAASDIQSKYIAAPYSTDFAILFVPSEAIYAEILRRPGLFEELQRKYKISVVGPSNLVAFLSSLQMGFRTLAIEQRSSEVWELLSAVKTQFGNFESILAKTRKKLQEASNVIDSAERRTRVISRQLSEVQDFSVV